MTLHDLGFNEAAAFRRGIPKELGKWEADELASMRPRHFAAEYLRGLDGLGPEVQASMRPRHFAAEYSWVETTWEQLYPLQ